MLREPDKQTVSVSLDLSAIWDEVVASGQITNEFVAPHDDPEGRWRGGDKILFGVTRLGQGFCYFARNLKTGEIIRAAIEEKEIAGTDFRCQFNGYRALRPGGRALLIGRQPEISPNPVECRFSCQDPTDPLSLLRRTPLAQIRLKSYVWNAYYNAAPLEIEGHFLWLPVRMSGAHLTLPHYLQTLNREVIEDIFLLRARSTNLLLFFNSLHAGASVNHLHIQSVYRGRPLAIEKQHASACRGFHVLNTYPAEGFVFQGDGAVEVVSEYVTRLQEGGVPFNLIWIGERVFLVPRDMEHEVTDEFPFNAFSATDICGKIVTTHRAAYDSASKERIEAALKKSTIPASKFLRD